MAQDDLLEQYAWPHLCPSRAHDPTCALARPRPHCRPPRRSRRSCACAVPIVNGPCGAKAFPIFWGRTRLGTAGLSGRQYRYSSCFGCLPVEHPVREALIFVVDSVWFERITLVAVLINCVLLGLQGPPQLPLPPSSPPPSLLEVASGAAASLPLPLSSVSSRAYEFFELSFTLFFTCEILCRIGAMGLAGHEYSYLADGWNAIDAFVVAAGWFALLFPQLGNLTAVRAIRALRPLRTITRIPGLRRQVIALSCT